MKNKQSYRIRNWKEYNQALVNRGSLTLWFEEEQIRQWYNTETNLKRGHPVHYSDVAIQCGLVIREVFSLPLRATEGFLCSLVSLLKLPLTVPDYTTFCRRQQTLDVTIPRRKAEADLHVVIDSTGLKVYGEGEWKVRKHGVSKRRTWRKLHLAVDANTQEVVAVELTSNAVGDSEVLPDLLDQMVNDEAIAAVSADGAYDTKECHQAIKARGAEAIIPPREGAVEWEPIEGEVHPRTAILRLCNEQGKAEWKKSSGYHLRSLAETAMFRFKCLFSGNLKNRRFDSQTTEAYCRTVAMNKMTFLGMPVSVLQDDCV